MDIELYCIGKYEINEQTKIILNKDFEKALINLDKFSHCLLFTKSNKQINFYISKIISVDTKLGILTIVKKKLEGFLIDIKPYFPCEEVINEKTRSSKFFGIPFLNEVIGKYHFVNQKEEIHLFNENESQLKLLNKGDFVRLIWWFDRFDNIEYRKMRMCNPPYENAPKSGIFSTRSPVRPNPIASTIVKILGVDSYNHYLTIQGFDGFENSYILQISPYEAEDIVENVEVPYWVDHWSSYKIFDENNHIVFNNEKDKIENIYIKELEENYELDLDKVNPKDIVIKNASINNLKSISLKIPKEEITAITGVSGSGKSSLAFDTIYQESQKQFIDLLATNYPIYDDLNETKVEKISGLLPSIAIDQSNLALNPRSTVGSISKISNYIKLLFSTIGERYCPNCQTKIGKNNVCSNCGTIMFELTPSVFSYNNPDYMCPECKGLGETYVIDENLIVKYPNQSILDGASPWWGNLRKFREKPNANWMKGEIFALAEDLNENLELPFNQLSESFKKGLFYGTNGKELSFKYKNSNGRQGIITRPVEGVINTMYRFMKTGKATSSMSYLDSFLTKKKCTLCNGERLKKEGRLVQIGNYRYPEVSSMNIIELKQWCHSTYYKLDKNDKTYTEGLFKKILFRLKKIEKVGLGYLSLDRSIPSLSGGEAQRLKIATQFGSGLTNILYIMDEPSKGLHPKDYSFLMDTINDLKKLNNTIILVEHKKDFINMSDFVIELGPKSGKYGGQIIREERIDKSIKYEKDPLFEFIPKRENRKFNKLSLYNVKTNNLKNINADFPISSFICVVGVSGSGKSSLISKTLYPAIQSKLGLKVECLGNYEKLTGFEQIKEIFYVSQKPIGKTPRSNPATYTGVFDFIRDFYASLEESKKKKLTKEHFSFNSKKGQCPECKGAAFLTVPMHFMPDIYRKCTKCNGKRYLDEVLTVKYKNYSIADILDCEVSEAKEIFKENEKIYQILDMLDKVGLGYLLLGQNAVTLSGGEAQRIKLAKNLCQNKTKNTLYILDEPTLGLNDKDSEKVIKILKLLVKKGATVIVIEHNPLLIKQADWIIELGPSGGDLGGYLINEGWQN